MNIRVHFTTQIRSALGMAGDVVELPARATVLDLLRRLAQQHGDSFRQSVLDADGHPVPSILMCVGDDQVTGSLDLPLNDGDEVTILSAISGG